MTFSAFVDCMQQKLFMRTWRKDKSNKSFLSLGHDVNEFAQKCAICKVLFFSSYAACSNVYSLFPADLVVTNVCVDANICQIVKVLLPSRSLLCLEDTSTIKLRKT